MTTATPVPGEHWQARVRGKKRIVYVCGWAANVAGSLDINGTPRYGSYEVRGGVASVFYLAPEDFLSRTEKCFGRGCPHLKAATEEAMCRSRRPQDTPSGAGGFPAPQPHERTMTPMAPKYPDIIVQLDGEDGNSFAIIGRCTKAMRRAKVDPAEIARFQAECMSGDYDNLLRVCMAWFDVN